MDELNLFFKEELNFATFFFYFFNFSLENINRKKTPNEKKIRLVILYMLVLQKMLIFKLKNFHSSFSVRVITIYMFVETLILDSNKFRVQNLYLEN